MAEIGEKKEAEVSPKSQPRKSANPTVVDDITPVAGLAVEGRASLDVDEKHIPDLEGQDGVRDIEAITQTWSKKMLIITYVWYANSSITNRETLGQKALIESPIGY